MYKEDRLHVFESCGSVELLVICQIGDRRRSAPIDVLNLEERLQSPRVHEGAHETSGDFLVPEKTPFERVCWGYGV
jgi:hypothetical protein